MLFYISSGILFHVQQGIGGGTLNLVQTPSRAKSNGPTEAYNQGGDGPNTDVEDGCLLRMAIEGEVCWKNRR